uniref:RNA-directed DNA polymerase homolog n=1 Tax=Nicotiana tabacum TaxID=4097 RepID=A0A1S3Z9V0_TOBAC|nr:PREDICTED: RNA-directed DNA polymerase homolog [Nicotiana tabacum]
MVIVKKKNEKWRICMDFTDLNKVYPKDSFPLPHIDQLIDTTAGHELLSFLDAYSGYNQILVEEDDQEKTTFITHRGTYCYRVMPFGWKNVGATYQRLVTKMFKHQLGKTMEVYINNMLVKSLRTMKEVFEILRKYGMKLNPKKCAFDVTSGKILGFLVSRRGIEVNPD